MIILLLYNKSDILWDNSSRMYIDMKNQISKSRSQKITDIILNHEGFQREFKLSKKRFLKTTQTITQSNGVRRIVRWNEKVLQKETSYLMDVYAYLSESPLPESWEPSIKGYLKTDNLIAPKSTTEPLVTFEIAEPIGRSKLNIQVFKYTTKKEYVEAWKKVENYQNNWMQELDPKPLSKRDLRIIKKDKQGKTAFQILQEIPDDISPSTVRKIISRKAPQLGVTLKYKKS